MTKDNSLAAVLLRAYCLKSKVTSDSDLSIHFFGYSRASRRRLKSARHSSNVVFEEFVLSSLKAVLHEVIFLATCNATMTNRKPFKLQRGCHTFATFFAAPS